MTLFWRLTNNTICQPFLISKQTAVLKYICWSKQHGQEENDMSRPSKPMAKNANSKFTPRSNKRDIFSKLAKTPKLKAGMGKQANNTDKNAEDGESD